ncbi:decarboxylase [Prochlorococcus marinus str. MU1404]|uniref:aminotransferase class I/II-fold pyridoxal phosphate-dependent enzyme n=1 Tax=Prochlorococcus marinus TaxID=1219 RepID=UPI001ADA43EA|nr:aminotransferase class I/II-fold pyridoxal phosphate-dependent enzyme [Prochlorococcus marinus]MBO8230333.1 aminotransferase class I/II-fold pyridoxal phosphate-dependent enzyme [Prochlorococcus marinus XMU1404]MBW3073437.1 decarboxylase [Prochlorococcus marinus str. MU1404]MCR8545332.1 aminotransferase class I/II-fold pyridoxal phosphate-dependent enzyme [Prochlorococcus marinus CUG1432]
MSISSFLTKKFLKSLFFPAHNRGAALPKKLVKLLKKQPGYWDLPELPEIGTPLSQSGLIAKTQREFSEKFGTKGCFFGVNGASGLIQSAVIAMANPGESILMPRNVHISVIKICAMQNIQPIFFDLDFSSENGHYKPITKSWLKNVFKKVNFNEKKIVGVILVSPSYQGYAGNLGPLIDLCHQKNLPVLVDEAHGSYFLFCQDLNLPKSALISNADLVVHSLHKSLNGLTQTAALWYKGNLVNEQNLIKSINLLQTTSPSSLLLSSCEESIKDWLDKKSLSKYQKRILEGRRIYKKLIQKNIPLIETQDPLKIVLNTSKVGIDGFTADKFFCKNGLIAELPEMMTLTFCLGFSNQKDFLKIFVNLWNKLLLNTKKLDTLKVIQSPFNLVEEPEIQIGIAWRSETRSIPFSQSLNKISGDIICPYPPGIPLLVPGEKIDIDRFNWINNQSLFNNDLLNFNIRVIKT